ncbi:unnamed protein product, partial [marine sediment metagenome]
LIRANKWSLSLFNYFDIIEEEGAGDNDFLSREGKREGEKRGK